MSEEILYQIALKNLDGIGPQRAKALVNHCGGVRPIFELSRKEVKLLPGAGSNFLNAANMKEALRKAEEELRFIEKNGMEVFFFLDSRYPKRLKHCPDAPVVLYGKGGMKLNPRYAVSIVGTREATRYGAKLTEQLIAGLAPFDALIVSGLANGIDTLAHRAAVAAGLQTVGVMGNSLDRVYPFSNRGLAARMLERGGLLSEFEHGTKPDRENFPQRNRIVAGMADVTVVVESGVKGGSMITARLAGSYNRDVAAFPGSVESETSSGCNHLIKTNQATMIEHVDDLLYLMGWEPTDRASAPQKQFFVELNEEEQQVVRVFDDVEQESLDNLSLTCGWPTSKTSTMLLELEFKGVVRSLPGKVYQLA